MDEPTIFACGGGGFDPDSSHGNTLDRYFVSLIEKSRPKICLIPTASADSVLRVASFYKACGILDCRPSTLELFRPPSSDLYGYVMDHDAIFVSGGSTRNLLVLWKEWGLDKALHKAWKNGLLLGGSSAGANCWFSGCSTDSNFGELDLIPALGWLPQTCVPHYDEEINRKPHAEKMILTNQVKELIAIDGGAGVLIKGEVPLLAIGSKSGQGAYRVSKKLDDFEEVPIPSLTFA